MDLDRLAPREREVAGLIVAKGEASASDICAGLSDPLSGAAVRTMLQRLRGKGVIRRRRAGRGFVYFPAW